MRKNNGRTMRENIEERTMRENNGRIMTENNGRTMREREVSRMIR